jgi:hypothetical protein
VCVCVCARTYTHREGGRGAVLLIMIRCTCQQLLWHMYGCMLLHGLPLKVKVPRSAIYDCKGYGNSYGESTQLHGSTCCVWTTCCIHVVYMYMLYTCCVHVHACGCNIHVQHAGLLAIEVDFVIVGALITHIPFAP